MSVPFILADDPRALTEHWCYALPPGQGLVASLTILFRGLMQPPRLRVHRDRIELFPDCPALAIPRRALSQQSGKVLEALERQEFLARRGDSSHVSHFRGYRTAFGGDFCLFDFDGDARLADAFEPGIWIEGFASALCKVDPEVKYEVSEVCRCAITNALFEEPVPSRPPPVADIERRFTEAVEADLAREEPDARKSWPPPPPSESRQPSARFMKPMFRQQPSSSSSSSSSSGWRRFGRSDTIELELEEARAAEKIYLRAIDLRQFMRGLIDRVARWQ